MVRYITHSMNLKINFLLIILIGGSIRGYLLSDNPDTLNYMSNSHLYILAGWYYVSVENMMNDKKIN